MNDNPAQPAMENPLKPFLERQSVMILDGGLATELEARGCDLDDDLWSARVLLEDHDLIRAVHRDYLEAGADCIVSASYQASVDGFRRRGLSEEEAAQLVVKSVELAIEARDAFWANPKNRTNRLRPLVAASVGPYGAYLADGSEYGGRYGVSDEELREFHRERFHLLAGSGADLLACETIPSAGEGYVLAELLRETPGTVAWFSFSCGDGRHLNDGTPLAEVTARLEDHEQVVALGVNCTAPEHIPSLIEEIAGETTKPIVVYPNSGERYDAATKRWVGESSPEDFGVLCGEWVEAGARLVGGCCRTGPGHVRAMRTRLRTSEG